MTENKRKKRREAKLECLENSNLELLMMLNKREREIQYLKNLLEASESEERRLSEIILKMSGV